MIRLYKPSDLKEITNLFYNTVHTINKKGYTQKQLEVWSPKEFDLEKWNKRFLETNTYVIRNDKMIVAYGNIDNEGYIDHFYVHHMYQGCGYASKLLKVLESEVKVKEYSVYASITAAPFFKHHGYSIIKENKVIRNDVTLINYYMSKENNNE